MKKFKGMKVEDVIKALEEMGEEFTVDRYEIEYCGNDDIFSITVGGYWSDHVELEIEDGVVAYVDYCEWD